MCVVVAIPRLCRCESTWRRRGRCTGSARIATHRGVCAVRRRLKVALRPNCKTTNKILAGSSRRKLHNFHMGGLTENSANFSSLILNAYKCLEHVSLLCRARPRLRIEYARDYVLTRVFCEIIRYTERTSNLRHKYYIKYFAIIFLAFICIKLINITKNG